MARRRSQCAGRAVSVESPAGKQRRAADMGYIAGSSGGIEHRQALHAQRIGQCKFNCCHAAKSVPHDIRRIDAEAVKQEPDALNVNRHFGAVLPLQAGGDDAMTGRQSLGQRRPDAGVTTAIVKEHDSLTGTNHIHNSLHGRHF